VKVNHCTFVAVAVAGVGVTENYSPLSISSNNASSDTSGSVGLQNIVDPVNLNYHLKELSSLRTVGVGGTYISAWDFVAAVVAAGSLLLGNLQITKTYYGSTLLSKVNLGSVNIL